MEIETINPIFMKALLKCHRFQRQAREKVSHNRRFFKQVLKVFKWQRRIRRQIKSNNDPLRKQTRPSLMLSSSISIRLTQNNQNLGLNSSIDKTETELSQDDATPNSKALAKREIIADLDIVRRNLWLIMVRKDIAQAHRRKVTLKEQKLLKARTIAHRCQSHFKQFQEQHNKDKKLD